MKYIRGEQILQNGHMPKNIALKENGSSSFLLKRKYLALVEINTQY
jgi:hypothetical protein